MSRAIEDSTLVRHGGQKGNVRKTGAIVERPQSRHKTPSYPQSNQDKSVGLEESIVPVAGGDGPKLKVLTGQLEKSGIPYLDRDIVRAKRSFSVIPLVTYKYDPGLARDEKIIVTVKTTLQRYRNLRQEEQQKRARSDVFGRERARRYVYGVVAAFSLSHDRLDWDLTQSEWSFSALEPYAVNICGKKIALVGGSYVRLIDMETGQATTCRHPWLSQVHTVQFSSDEKKLLVASTGFDAVIEFDAESGEVSWEWFAWEHGFDRSMLGHYVVRFPERSEALAAIGQEALLVEDPSSFEFGIPTRLIPAHLNSALYDVDGRILVSLFHQGTGNIIDRHTGKVRKVISGLVNPHKLSTRRRGGGYHISDTRRGNLVFLDENYRRVSEISLSGLPGVERSLLLSEFLQNTTELKDDLFACIDIHRNSIWLIDVERHKFRGIKFPVEWSVHDIACVEQEHLSRVGGLVGKALGKVEAIAQREGKMIRHFSVDGQEIATFNLDPEGWVMGLDVEM